MPGFSAGAVHVYRAVGMRTSRTRPLFSPISQHETQVRWGGTLTNRPLIFFFLIQRIVAAAAASSSGSDILFAFFGGGGLLLLLFLRLGLRRRQNILCEPHSFLTRSGAEQRKVSSAVAAPTGSGTRCSDGLASAAGTSTASSLAGSAGPFSASAALFPPLRLRRSLCRYAIR